MYVLVVSTVEIIIQDHDNAREKGCCERKTTVWWLSPPKTNYRQCPLNALLYSTVGLNGKSLEPRTKLPGAVDTIVFLMVFLGFLHQRRIQGWP